MNIYAAYKINNIVSDLNDSISAAAQTGGLSATETHGENGYIKFSNNVIMQWGKIALSTQTQAWTQPVLTGNGTLGGSEFACSASSEYGSGFACYKLFDNDSSSYYSSSTSSRTCSITIYNPTALQIIKFVTKPYSTNYNISSITVQASNTNGNWTNLTSSVSTNTTTGIQTVTITNDSFYKYYKFTITSPSYAHLYYMNITANYQTSVANTITFPVAFSNKNYYGISFAYIGAPSNTAYISSFSKTAVALSGVNSSSSSAKWVALGY